MQASWTFYRTNCRPGGPRLACKQLMGHGAILWISRSPQGGLLLTRGRAAPGRDFLSIPQKGSRKAHGLQPWENSPSSPKALNVAEVGIGVVTTATGVARAHTMTAVGSEPIRPGRDLRLPPAHAAGSTAAAPFGAPGLLTTGRGSDDGGSL